MKFNVLIFFVLMAVLQHAEGSIMLPTFAIVYIDVFKVHRQIDFF